MEGVFAQIFYLSGTHDPLPQFFAVFNTHEVDNHGNCHIFWKNCSFTECVPQKTTSACVDSNPRGIQPLASSVAVQDNLLQAHVPSPVRATKAMANEARVIWCVHVYKHN